VNSSNQDKYKQVLNGSISLLARREYSVKMLSEKLAKKYVEADKEIIENVISFLIEKKLLSDLRFAEMYTRSKLEMGWGPQKIKFQLRNKGIPKEMVSELEQNYFEVSADKVFELAEKKFGNRVLDPKKAKDKIFRFLVGRGFGFDVSREACERFLKSR
jgi:regulatory protein